MSERGRLACFLTCEPCGDRGEGLEGDDCDDAGWRAFRAFRRVARLENLRREGRSILWAAERMASGWQRDGVQQKALWISALWKIDIKMVYLCKKKRTFAEKISKKYSAIIDGTSCYKISWLPHAAGTVVGGGVEDVLPFQRRKEGAACLMLCTAVISPSHLRWG